MVFRRLLLVLLLPLSLSLFGGSLNEDLLLAAVSTLFFGSLFFRLRQILDGLLHQQVEEIHRALADLLLLKLERLSALVAFGLRLLAVALHLLPLLRRLLFRLARSLPPVGPFGAAAATLLLHRRLRRGLGRLVEGEEQTASFQLNLLLRFLQPPVEGRFRLGAAVEQLA